jgi:acyloxyacyl hydrolase
MRRSLFSLLSAVLLIGSAPAVLADVNGGKVCAGCTVILGLVEQSAQIHAVSVTQALSMVCGFLPSPYNYTCSSLIQWYGPSLIKMLEDQYTPDVICNVINVCNSSSGKTCRLYPAPKSSKLLAGNMQQSEFEQHLAEAKAKYGAAFEGLKFNACDWFPQACNIGDHKPVFDNDGDMFSTYGPLRGNHWRGQDCDDNNSGVFPGRHDLDIAADNNCNGIWGVNPATNVPYEQELCEGTGQMGVAILGDSATAHFRIPPGYLTAANLSAHTFQNLLRNVENELDFPMLSWSTGHLTTDEFYPDVSGKVDSIYLRMRQNNLCNNNDYQNIGVNGASSGNLVDFGNILSRNSDLQNLTTKPLLLFMAMIGNDVCSHDDQPRNSPEEYKQNFKRAILGMDSRLPKGTKVVLVGLVDGRILYESMHNRIHPIGATNQDV